MNKANDLAIDIVQDYCERLERQGNPHLWLSPEFAQVSYSKSAAYMVLEALKSAPDVPPLQIVEEFRDKMNRFSSLNQQNSVVFSTMCDAADDIIHSLIKAY